jgi:hypothetical protein
MIRSSGLREGRGILIFLINCQIVYFGNKILWPLEQWCLVLVCKNRGSLLEKHGATTWKPSQHLLQEKKVFNLNSI